MIPYEFEVKEMLEEAGITVEKSCLVSRKDKNYALCLESLSPPLVVKAQVRGWGRGKLGLVKFVKNKDEIDKAISEIFDSTYQGKRIEYVLVSEKVDVKRELYLSLMVDQDKKAIMLLASLKGGIDVEEAAKDDAEILKMFIKPFEGVREYMVRRIAKFFGKNYEEIRNLLYGLYNIFTLYDMTLLEINPLIDTGEKLVAVDRKAIIDDDALMQNPLLRGIAERYLNELSIVEKSSFEKGFNLVTLEGNIAVIGNGAGLTMATMDLVKEYGGNPGIFLDLGGGASAERVFSALKIVFSLENIDRVLVNVLGGITRCDEVAKGIVKALEETDRKEIKVVVRLSGLYEDEGRRILQEHGLYTHSDLIYAVKEVIR